MTDKETALCKRYSRRDENGKVHCFRCPLIIDKNACVCKRVLEDSLNKSYEYDKNQLPIV
jgi:hypothetical protein